MITKSHLDGRNHSIHQAALTPFILRIRFLEVISRTCHAAAAAGGENVEGLAAQVVSFDEGVDDGGGCVPPDGEANPHGVVVSDVLATAFDGGT